MFEVIGQILLTLNGQILNTNHLVTLNTTTTSPIKSVPLKGKQAHLLDGRFLDDPDVNSVRIVSTDFLSASPKILFGSAASNFGDARSCGNDLDRRLPEARLRPKIGGS